MLEGSYDTDVFDEFVNDKTVKNVLFRQKCQVFFKRIKVQYLYKAIIVLS